jgi:tetratricopeptide (TPR) repeat protein
MSQEAMAIIERLFKAAVFVPVMALVAWWILTSWMDGTLTLQEAVVGWGLCGAAFLVGVVSIVRGGWGFLGVLAFVYVALLAVVVWEYIYWRRSEKDHLAAEVGKYEEAIARDPGNAAAYSFLGEVHLRLGEFEEAAAALEKALELDPESKRDRRLLRQARERQAVLPWRRLD